MVLNLDAGGKQRAIQDMVNNPLLSQHNTPTHMQVCIYQLHLLSEKNFKEQSPLVALNSYTRTSSLNNQFF